MAVGVLLSTLVCMLGELVGNPCRFLRSSLSSPVPNTDSERPLRRPRTSARSLEVGAAGMIIVVILVSSTVLLEGATASVKPSKNGSSRGKKQSLMAW